MSMENVLNYEEKLLERLKAIYGSRLSSVIKALARPPKEYSLRVNALRADVDEVIEDIEEMGFDCRASGLLEEAVLVEVKGPYALERAGKLVVAKKGAAESVMLGSKLYAPGVLRCEKYRVGDLVRIEDPKGHLVGRGIALIPPKLGGERREGLAVDTKESIYRLPPFRETHLYRLGLIREQSVPAMIASRALEPRKGEVVVDMCAAPGGKTLHVAQLMEDQGRIYAFDSSEERLNVLIREMERMGFRSIVPICHDSRYLDVDFPTLKADKVLVDPPCSALGVRPKLYEDSNYKKVIGCAEYQRQFMKVASRIVKRGGTIVYSTCTLTLEENEEVVKFAVERLGLELEDQCVKIGEEGLGIKEAQRFNPDKLDMPGYFIAKFVKK